MSEISLIEDQKKFYEEKYLRFGDDPRSLGYNDAESQRLRFEILRRLFLEETSARFSVHEAGCGLAHMAQFFQEKGISCEYSGSDISRHFVEQAKGKFPGSEFWLQDMAEDFDRLDPALKGKDYYVASGMFNPVNANPLQQWEKFIWKTVGNMFQACRKGISFNLLSLYSEESRRSPDLYYADPRIVYDWCKTHLSRFVSVLEDSPLYEFTVLVYKKEFVKSRNPSPLFEKYFRD